MIFDFLTSNNIVHNKNITLCSHGTEQYVFHCTSYNTCDIYLIIMTMKMTMTMKISLSDINHLNTMIGGNKDEKNNVVNEQETI